MSAPGPLLGAHYFISTCSLLAISYCFNIKHMRLIGVAFYEPRPLKDHDNGNVLRTLDMQEYRVFRLKATVAYAFIWLAVAS